MCRRLAGVGPRRAVRGPLAFASHIAAFHHASPLKSPESTTTWAGEGLVQRLQLDDVADNLGTDLRRSQLQVPGYGFQAASHD